MPLVDVDIEVDKGRSCTIACVLDTGAAGASLMLSQPAATQLGLLPDRRLPEPPPAEAQAVVPRPRRHGGSRAWSLPGISLRGRQSAGAGSTRAAPSPPPPKGAATVTVRTVGARQTQWRHHVVRNVTVGGRAFGQQRALYTADRAPLRASVYGGSLLGSSVLGKHTLVLDLRNHRFAIRDDSIDLI